MCLGWGIWSLVQFRTDGVDLRGSSGVKLPHRRLYASDRVQSLLRDRKVIEMKKKSWRGQTMVGSSLVIVASALIAQGGPRVFTVCTIASQPEKFESQSVTVRARVLSDGMHGTILYDESCEDFGLHLFVNDDAKGREGLETALTWCHSSTRGKFIEGTFTGMVHFEPATPPQHRITVQRIEDLTVRSTHTTSASFPTPCPDPPTFGLH